MPYLNRTITLTVPETRYLYTIAAVVAGGAFAPRRQEATFEYPSTSPTFSEPETFDHVETVRLPPDVLGNDPASYLSVPVPYNLTFKFVYQPYDSITVDMTYRVTAVSRELESTILSVTPVSRSQVPSELLGALTRTQIWVFRDWRIVGLVRGDAQNAFFDVWGRIVSDSDALALFLTGTDATDPASQESLTVRCRSDERIKPGLLVSVSGSSTNYVVSTVTVDDERYMDIGLMGR